MATTMFFEEKLVDKEDKSATMEMEFGRSSFYGDSLIYMIVNGNSVMMDEKTGRKFCEAVRDLAIYLQYDKP